jgi:hypothetical protein
MENENIQQTPPQPSQFQIQEAVPNSTAVLVLGIVSIVTCFCYGIIGLVAGIIALVLATKGITLYKATPERYSLSSFKNLKAGKTCAIIGLSLSAMYLIFIIIYVAVVGVALSTMPWQMYQ